MKKQLKIVMLLLSLMCVLNFTGCTTINTPLLVQPGGHFYSLGASPSYITYNGRWTTERSIPLVSDSGMQIMSNPSEVDEVFGELIHNEEQDWINDDFINTTASFNEEFFENKQLVCFVFAANSGDYEFQLLNTSYKNSVLTTKINYKQGYTFGVIFWLAMIEIDKVPTDTTIEIVYKSNS